MDKKGQAFEQLGKLAMGVVTVGIILVIGFMIMSQGKSQISTTDGAANVSACQSAGCNATDDMVAAVDDIPGWVPIVIIVGIGMILIMMVKTFSKG